MTLAQTSFPEMTAEQVERLRPLWAEFERALRTDPDYLVLIAEAGPAAREESIRTAWDAALVESRERARMQKASERAAREAARAAAAEERRAARLARHAAEDERRAARAARPHDADRDRRLERRRERYAARPPEKIAADREEQRLRRLKVTPEQIARTNEKRRTDRAAARAGQTQAVDSAR